MAVAARIIDKRDAEDIEGRAGLMLAGQGMLAHQPAPKGFQAVHQPHQRGQEGQLQLGQVFTALIVVGV